MLERNYRTNQAIRSVLAHYSQ
ncbi:hypothetical protein LAZ93_12365 [Paenibacillus polymyxa]|nr:hypothetical protein HFD99_16175 [Paenibacillus sp. EKM301P]MBY7736044.1 hypothetical protein [Paenibacillus polymyxa]UBS89665.1 hypothetical protein LAZ93_12365 [Paenibacillus polymyxa]